MKLEHYGFRETKRNLWVKDLPNKIMLYADQRETKIKYYAVIEELIETRFMTQKEIVENPNIQKEINRINLIIDAQKNKRLSEYK